MNKKTFLFVLLIFVLSITTLTVLLTMKKIKKISFSKELIDEDFYIMDREQWQKIDQSYFAKSDSNNFEIFLPENMSGGNAKSFNQLVKGYLVKYDIEKDYIILRTLVPSTKNIYRDVIVHMKKEDTVFCWPKVLEQKETKNIFFDLDNTNLISLPNEKPLIAQSASNYWNETSFFIIQLDHDVNVKEINLSKKIAWLCE